MSMSYSTAELYMLTTTAPTRRYSRTHRYSDIRDIYMAYWPPSFPKEQGVVVWSITGYASISLILVISWYPTFDSCLELILAALARSNLQIHWYDHIPKNDYFITACLLVTFVILEWFAYIVANMLIHAYMVISPLYQPVSMNITVWWSLANTG